MEYGKLNDVSFCHLNYVLDCLSFKLNSGKSRYIEPPPPLPNNFHLYKQNTQKNYKCAKAIQIYSDLFLSGPNIDLLPTALRYGKKRNWHISWYLVNATLKRSEICLQTFVVSIRDVLYMFDKNPDMHVSSDSTLYQQQFSLLFILIKFHSSIYIACDAILKLRSVDWPLPLTCFRPIKMLKNVLSGHKILRGE